MIKIYRDHDKPPNPVEDIELVLRVMRQIRREYQVDAMLTLPSYNGFLMHTFQDFEQTERCFEKRDTLKPNIMEKKDIIIKNISNDVGCKDEKLHLTVPRWNIDYEKRLFENYLTPFIKAVCNVEEKDLFEWIQNSGDFFKGYNINARKMINRAREKYVKKIESTLKNSGGKLDLYD